jgi:dipeptidyl aminopeptidase/acylaminoacyl peptidase
VRTSLAAVDELAILDISQQTYKKILLPFVSIGEIQMLSSGSAFAFAQDEKDSAKLIQIDLDDGSFATVHQPSARPVSADWIAAPQAIEFPTKAGSDGAPRTSHAWFYPPTNPSATGAPGKLPPLIVTIHGGPTSASKPILNLSRQYWTSRGFALVDVNYGGSTSYGRNYRRRLNGQWGIVDVQDAIAAVDYLVANQLVDPAQVAIRGGSAGGFTTLAALAFHDRFRAGANLFGVADIKALAATSHKFERHYDVSLVGPPNEDLYRERSPLFNLDGFSEPLITLQGSEDKVVPPAQSQAIVAALDARKVPHAYIEFAGEQHGFRQSENIIRAQEAELYFYGQIFGFTPADAIQPVEIKHWPR